MAYTFENPEIQKNLQGKFKGNQVAARIALVIDGLLGKSVKDIDDRSKHLVDVINFHFDDPKGRIVKIEKMLEAICDHLGITPDVAETRLDKIEGKLDKLLNHHNIQ